MTEKETNSMRTQFGFLTVLLCITTAVGAQQSANLTRAQEGRAEVAKCYTRCLGGADSGIIRIGLDALDGEWSTSTFLYMTCVTLQTSAKSADACRAGCADIETAYGVRSSHIRTRFHHLLNDSLRTVRASGLWTAWNRYPTAGSDAFTRACNRYAGLVQSNRVTAASKLEEIEPESLDSLKARVRAVIEDEYQPNPPPISDFELQTLE